MTTSIVARWYSGIAACWFAVCMPSMASAATPTATPTPTSRHCDVAFKTTASGGYLKPNASAAVSLARSSAPAVPIATTTTDPNGLWCVSLPASANYNVTVAGTTRMRQFLIADDMAACVIPTPSPTVTP